jgi:hypothetical protein
MLKALLASTASLVVLMTLGAGTATASSKPACWTVVVSDWYADGRVDGTYPTACYEQAIQHLPGDVKAYADAADEIQRAMLAAQRNGGTSSKDGSDGGGKGDRRAAPIAFGHDRGDPPRGVLSSLIERVGPKNAGSVPLPLLVLAGIAFLLLAAAAASFVARRIQARRVMPAPAPAPASADGKRR